jgi:hypothetical protein
VSIRKCYHELRGIFEINSRSYPWGVKDLPVSVRMQVEFEACCCLELININFCLFPCFGSSTPRKGAQRYFHAGLEDEG